MATGIALLDALFFDGGYLEYQVKGMVNRQTEAGCDRTQMNSYPTLFVFAYDWLLDNANNATLLKDYLAFIQDLYPADHGQPGIQLHQPPD